MVGAQEIPVFGFGRNSRGHLQTLPVQGFLLESVRGSSATLKIQNQEMGSEVWSASPWF